MSTTTKQPPTAPAADPIDPRKHIRQLLLRAARGEEIDKQERRDALENVDWEPRKWKRMLDTVKARFQAVARIDTQQCEAREREALEAERQAIRERCNENAKQRRIELEAQLEVELAKCNAPLREFDAANSERIESLPTAVDPRLQNFLQRTADPRIGQAIATENIKLFHLDGECRTCMDSLLEKQSHIDQVEWTGTGPRLASRTTIDRSHWVAMRDSAIATIEDESAGTGVRRRAESQYHTAARRVEEIDAAQQRIGEIESERVSIYERIKMLSEQYAVPEYFAINFSADDSK